MDTNNKPLDSGKTKNDGDTLRRYWRIFIPLTVILVLMVRFPLRIDLREAFWDAVFYGTISLTCIATAIYIYRRFGKRIYRLIAVMLLCSILSGWQIIDMTILRYDRPFGYSFAGLANIFEPLHKGETYYSLHFPRDDIVCHILIERYIGNNFMAIVYSTDRYASWGACGG